MLWDNIDVVGRHRVPASPSALQLEHSKFGTCPGCRQQCEVVGDVTYTVLYEQPPANDSARHAPPQDSFPKPLNLATPAKLSFIAQTSALISQPDCDSNHGPVRPPSPPLPQRLMPLKPLSDPHELRPRVPATAECRGLTRPCSSFPIFLVLAITLAASTGVWFFVPRFCPKDTQL
jgi:hypothetical protein